MRCAVTEVIAPLQVALSVKVTGRVFKLSTVGGVVFADNAGGAGAGILNVDDVTEVRPVAVNCMVAPDTGPRLVAVSPLKVAVPPDAVAFRLGPPSV